MRQLLTSELRIIYPPLLSPQSRVQRWRCVLVSEDYNVIIILLRLLIFGFTTLKLFLLLQFQILKEYLKFHYLLGILVFMDIKQITQHHT